MSAKPTIIIKSEKRLLWRDPLNSNPNDPGIVFVILEQQMEEAHPVHGKSWYQIVVNAQLVTRKQLEGLRDLITQTLEETNEGRVIMPPPGTMVPHR